MGVGLLFGDPPRAIQYITLVELEKGIQLLGRVVQKDLFAA